MLSSLLAFTWTAGATSSLAAQQPQQTDAANEFSRSDEEKTSSSVTRKSPDSASEDSQDYDTSLGPHLLQRFARDQEQFWTFPGRIRVADADWLMPLALTTAFLIGTDTEFSKHLSNSPSRINKSTSFSNYGIGAMGAMAGGLYLWGKVTRDDHKRETGFLAGEAAINSFAAVYGLKYALGRERPLQGDYRGNFRSGGDSFPSEHAAAAWSIASVVAHEYPGTLTQILVYGMATAVSASRLTAKQHFPSDVLVGSAIGWVSGEVVYRAHHDPELGGSLWPNYSEARSYFEGERPRQNMGTTLVELDSWVYPAVDRLAGLGYIHKAFEGVRPWSRMQCAVLIEEATDALLDRGAVGDGAAALVLRLRHEFSYEVERLDGGRNTTAVLDSIYTRAVSISGPALTDGFHFGQTVSYDFGRPFQRGTNLQEGGSFRAAAGPIAVYVRGEFQHAPGAPAPSDAVRSFIAQRDLVPEPPDVPVSPINQFQLLDAYIGVNVSNWQILAGRQSLSWGPGPGGSLIWSNNSEPIDMVRLTNSESSRLPGFLEHLGPVSVDQFIGRLDGGTFIPHPYIYGSKISLKPFPNFEFGYGRTVTIGGKGGDPLTPGNFLDSFFGRSSSSTQGGSIPGDSHIEIDWTFNVPKVRNYLVLYGEWYSDDDPIPMVAPRRSSYRPGFYIPHFPRLPKLDLHVEAANTQSPFIARGVPNTGDLNYWNFTYRDGYTNNGFLIGNVVGRFGQTYQGWLTYWVSPRDTFQVTYKNSSVGTAYLPGGGAWQDYALRNELYLKSGLYIKSEIQYEHISHFPILFKGPQSNLTATLELGFLHDAKQR